MLSNTEWEMYEPDMGHTNDIFMNYIIILRSRNTGKHQGLMQFDALSIGHEQLPSFTFLIKGLGMNTITIKMIIKKKQLDYSTQSSLLIDKNKL